MSGPEPPAAGELLALALGSPEHHVRTLATDERRRPGLCGEREGGSQSDHQMHYNIIVFIPNINIH